jgi:hypothetical protein
MNTVELIPVSRDSFPRLLCGRDCEQDTKESSTESDFPSALRQGVSICE